MEHRKISTRIFLTDKVKFPFLVSPFSKGYKLQVRVLKYGVVLSCKFGRLSVLLSRVNVTYLYCKNTYPHWAWTLAYNPNKALTCIVRRIARGRCDVRISCPPCERNILTPKKWKIELGFLSCFLRQLFRPFLGLQDSVV